MYCTHKTDNYLSLKNYIIIDMLHARIYELESVEAAKGMFIQIKNEKKNQELF